MSDGTSGNKGSDGVHKHPISYTSVSGPLTTNHNIAVRYVDVILCKYNGFEYSGTADFWILINFFFYYVSDVTRSYNCCK